MVDLQLASRMSQWTLGKNYHRAQLSGSTASTPDLDDSDRIRIAPSSSPALPALDTSDALLQDRYLSSEEDLSPTEPVSADRFGGDDDVVEIVEATALPAAVGSRPPRSCAFATTISYVSAGRAKVVDVSDAVAARGRTFSVPAVANAVPILKSPVPRMSRVSLGSFRSPAAADRPSFPAPPFPQLSHASAIVPPMSSAGDRRRSSPLERRKSSVPGCQRPPLSRSPLSFEPTSAPPTPSVGSLRSPAKVVRHYSLALTPSESFDEECPSLRRSATDLLVPGPPALGRSQSTEPETVSPILELPPPHAECPRPSSVRSSYSQSPRSKRVSTVHVRQRSGSFQLPSVAPAFLPLTPETPTFLNEDPFAKKDEDQPVPETGKTHRRLRSLSRTLSLAKIAVMPQARRGSTWAKSKGKNGDKNNRDSMDLLSPVAQISSTPRESFLAAPSPLAPNMPPTPITPATPATPATPLPPTPATAMFNPRSSSRLSSTTVEEETEPERQPRKSSLAARPKLTARGADERAPALELPPFPDRMDGEPRDGRRRLRKRKSTMSFAS